MTKYYDCFNRTWWQPNAAWPGGREPGAGERNYRGHPQHVTEEDAQEHCAEWNSAHDPGPLSNKAEYESAD